MSAAATLARSRYLATDGAIAVANLQGARRRSWRRFAATPLAAGCAERVVDEEQATLQFLGDVDALDRLASLEAELQRVDPSSARTALVCAQVASAAHRFADARRYLAAARHAGAAPDALLRVALALDQACGTRLDDVLAERRRLAEASGNLADLVPLGALLADLHEFAAADTTYRQALESYDDVSPFAPAWAAFQLGMLWGECVPAPDLAQAAAWYDLALDYIPGYVKARVHRAEIHLRANEAAAAAKLLEPAIASGDPEVRWRLGDALAAQGLYVAAGAALAAARAGYAELLARHRLAFADHAAEFHAGSGGDLRQALDLALANVHNRPTLRAFEQAHAIAVDAGDPEAASRLAAAAEATWGATRAFALSLFADA